MLSGQIDGQSLFGILSLQQVNLSNNMFTAIIVLNATGSVSQLVAIDLSFNILSGSLSLNFATFTSLSALSLRVLIVTKCEKCMYEKKITHLQLMEMAKKSILDPHKAKLKFQLSKVKVILMLMPTKKE